MLAIPSLVAVVLEDIPKAFSLADDGIHRQDVPLIPRNVIREAIVNALMHRNYRQHQPVQVVRYSNRIEIRNPGYSLIPDERLGEPGSKTRNPRLASVLHDTGYAETKGTGIRAMREAMEKANLTLPLFESDRARDEFTVRLLTHHLLGPEDWQWLASFKDCNLEDDEARALIVLREVGAIDNASYRSINHVDTLTASGHLRRLRDLDLIEQKGKGAATYYVPGRRLAVGQPQPPSPAPTAPGTPVFPGSTPSDKPLSEGLPPLPEGVPPLPEGLTAQLHSLGHRAKPAAVRAVIAALCAHHPMRPADMGVILGRNAGYLRETYLTPMVEAGELEYTHPENPAHPQQAYRAPQAKPEAQP
jgi:ATP-dependent DNA helicase RecG